MSRDTFTNPVGRPPNNPTITQRIGRNIRRARDERGYTQAYLAQLIGEEYPHRISLWERGRHRPADEKLERLADALGLPGIGWFFEVREDQAA